MSLVLFVYVYLLFVVVAGLLLLGAIALLGKWLVSRFRRK